MRPEDLGLLLISAVRYALGRQTYIVSETCRIVKLHASGADMNTVGVLRRDIHEALKRVDQFGKTLGGGCDDAAWRDLLRHLGGPVASHQSRITTTASEEPNAGK